MRAIDVYLNDIFVTVVYVSKELDYDDAVAAAQEQVELFFDVVADD